MSKMTVTEWIGRGFGAYRTPEVKDFFPQESFRDPAMEPVMVGSWDTRKPRKRRRLSKRDPYVDLTEAERRVVNKARRGEL